VFRWDYTHQLDESTFRHDSPLQPTYLLSENRVVSGSRKGAQGEVLGGLMATTKNSNYPD
jgi:hypothetical protein